MFEHPFFWPETGSNYSLALRTYGLGRRIDLSIYWQYMECWLRRLLLETELITIISLRHHSSNLQLEGSVKLRSLFNHLELALNRIAGVLTVVDIGIISRCFVA